VPRTFGAGDELREARFDTVDLSGARMRDVNLSNAKIVDANLSNADISGWIAGMRVNGVEVAPLVEAELDRMQPERVTLRAADPQGRRDAWAFIETTWSATVDRARALPEPAWYERVDEEWSFVETLRHLVFATDAWFRSAVLDEPEPFHRLGLTHTAYGRDAAAALGIDGDARPSLDEVLAVRRDRMTEVREYLAVADAATLEELTWRPPAPGYPHEARRVGDCIGVVIEEEWAHNQYAQRDLGELEATRG
jgi:hypothetical protein